MLLLTRVPELSVIVAAYSPARETTIRRLLQSLFGQSYQNFEVVFVVEKSRSLHTFVSNMVRELGLRGQVIFFEHLGSMSAARNAGVHLAKGRIVAFLDDDAIPWSGWTKSVVWTFAIPNVIGVTGPAIPESNSAILALIPEELDWIVGGTRWFRSNRIVPVRNGWGMNFAFLRDGLIRCGGFREDYGLRKAVHSAWGDRPSEDVDLSIRISTFSGKRILYVPDMGVMHHVSDSDISLRGLIHKCIGIGYTRRLIQTTHGTEEVTFTFENEALRGAILLPLKAFLSLPRAHMLLRSMSLAFLVATFTFVGYCQAFARTRQIPPAPTQHLTGDTVRTASMIVMADRQARAV